MKIRLILLVLSLLAFLSTATGGLLYYQALKEAAFKDAERQTLSRLAMIQRNLSAYLSENIKPVRALAGMEQLFDQLTHPDDPRALNAANAVLDLFQSSLEAEVCYLMNQAGVTVASSNRNAPDSFVGQNFAFRPYFQEAIHNSPSTYLALGTASGKRGIYYSYPIFKNGEDIPIGLAVIKSSVEPVEKNLDLLEDETILMVDPMGIISSPIAGSRFSRASIA
jgi:C4-dicarboxylate-specific signal transduction histidine kinase